MQNKPDPIPGPAAFCELEPALGSCLDGPSIPGEDPGPVTLYVRSKIDTVSGFDETSGVKTLAEMLPDVDRLSEEDQAGLAAHILANLRRAPLGPNDEEVAMREAEIDAGTAELITFDELRTAFGR